MVQIESRKGLAAAAEIAAVDGVDGIFIGPSDLSAALGHLGDAEPPGGAGGDRAACSTPPRRPASRSASWRRSRPTRASYMAMGATFVAVGSDLGVFRGATQALRDRFARSG